MLILADLSVEHYNILYIEGVSDPNVTVGGRRGGRWPTGLGGSRIGQNSLLEISQTFAINCRVVVFDGWHFPDVIFPDALTPRAPHGNGTPTLNICLSGIYTPQKVKTVL